MNYLHILNLTSSTPAFKPYEFSPTWQILLGFFIILALLLFSNLLRRIIPFLKKTLLPVSFIGGAIGLGLKVAFQYIEQHQTGLTMMTNSFTSMLQVITYHALAIGFISLGLKVISEQKEKKKELGRDSLKGGLLIIGTYLLQAIVGVIITIIFSLVFDSVAPFGGVLLPMGYGQGPGQAMNIGSVFQDQGGFAGGLDFGISISTLGFLSAGVGGVIFLNYAAKKGYVKRRDEDDITPTSVESIEKQGEVPLSESIDKITIQVALVSFTYFLTYGLMFGLQKLLQLTGVPFLSENLVGLIYGFNFIFATMIAMLVKKVITSFHKKRIIRRQYINNFMLERIAGLAFDLMIIASIMAIDVRNLSDPGLLVTLLVMGVTGAMITYLYVMFITRKAFSSYKHQAFVTFYGNLTGTASDGIALLREIDPLFETPSSDTLVYGSTVAIALGFPVLLITGYIHKDYQQGLASTSLWVSVAVMILYFIAINLVFYFILKKQRKKDLVVNEDVEA